MLKHVLALWLLAALLLAVFNVRAEDTTDDDDDAVDDAGADTGAGAGGEDAAEKPLGYGLQAGVFFPKNTGAGRVPISPAGEKVETLVTITNQPGNPEYSAVFISAHLHPLNDFSRFYQNFSGNPYKRDLTPGQHTTLKYSFTPDANAEPMEFSLVVRVFIQPANDPNSTFAISAYNSTITINEALGTDPRTVFTILLFAGLVAGGAYYYQQKSSGSTAAKVARNAANTVEVAANVKVDQDFLPTEHLEYLEKMKKQRGRSGSPKSQ